MVAQQMILSNTLQENALATPQRPTKGAAQVITSFRASLCRGLIASTAILGLTAGFVPSSWASSTVHQARAADDDAGSRKGIMFTPLDANGALTIGPGTVSAMRATGAGWIRVDFQTDKAGGLTPKFYAAYDALIGWLTSQGFTILGLLGNGFAQADSLDARTGKPYAGSPEDCQRDRYCEAAYNLHNSEFDGGNGDNPTIHAFAAQARTLAAHYPQIKYWELWNEPNRFDEAKTSAKGGHCNQDAHTGYNCYGGTWIYPSNYAQLSHLVTQYIQVSIPDAVTISGGLFGQSNSDISNQSYGITYLQDVYAYSDQARWRGSPWKYVGIHPYVCAGSAACPKPVDVRIRMRDYLRRMYDADHRFDMFVTEFGWEASAVGPDRQAQDIQAAYTVFKEWRKHVRMAAVFRWIDVGDNKTFGLLDKDNQQRPAYSMFTSISGF